MSMADARSTSFSGGRVFTRAVGAIQGNLEEFGKFGLAFFVAPAVVLGLLALPFYQQTGFTGGVPSVPWGPTGLMSLVSLAFTLIGYAGLIWGYWADTGGRKPSFAEMTRSGLSSALPVLLTGFLMGLGIFAGFVLLFVPGVILGVMWCVAIPAQVVEKPDGLGAFGRSRTLTRGNRWAIFGMFLLYFLALYAVLLLIALMVGIGSGVGMLAGLSMVTGPMAIVRVLLTAVWNGVFGVFGAVFVSALYYELRSIKDGLAPESLSQVFE